MNVGERAYSINGKKTRIYNVNKTDELSDFISKEKDFFKENGIELNQYSSNAEILEIFKSMEQSFFAMFTEDLKQAKLTIKLNDHNIIVWCFLINERKYFNNNIFHKDGGAVPIDFVGNIGRYNAEIYQITIY